MSRQAGPEEALKAAFQYLSNNQFTAIPCIVVAIRENLNTQVVDIQPTLNQKLKDGSVKERPPILGVPVVFPASKTAAFTFPISVGDTGLAVFSMRSIETWKQGNGYPSTPPNFSKMDKSDAIFIPGLQPTQLAINNPAKRLWPHSTSDAVMVNNIGTTQEVEVRLQSSGSIVINTNQDATINCANASIVATTSIDLTAPSMSVSVGNTSWTGNITHVGNYTQTGTYTLDAINMNTHVHPIVSGSSAPGPTGGPQ